MFERYVIVPDKEAENFVVEKVKTIVPEISYSVNAESVEWPVEGFFASEIVSGAKVTFTFETEDQIKQSGKAIEPYVLLAPLESQ